MTTILDVENFIFTFIVFFSPNVDNSFFELKYNYCLDKVPEIQYHFVISGTLDIIKLVSPGFECIKCLFID